MFLAIVVWRTPLVTFGNGLTASTCASAQQKQTAATTSQRSLSVKTRLSSTTPTITAISTLAMEHAQMALWKKSSSARMAKSCRWKLAVEVQRIFAITFTRTFHQAAKPNVVFCSAVLRLMVRLWGSCVRLRITSPRMRLRVSGLAFALSPPNKHHIHIPHQKKQLTWKHSQTTNSNVLKRSATAVISIVGTFTQNCKNSRPRTEKASPPASCGSRKKSPCGCHSHPTASQPPSSPRRSLLTMSRNSWMNTTQPTSGWYPTGRKPKNAAKPTPTSSADAQHSKTRLTRSALNRESDNGENKKISIREL